MAGLLSDILGLIDRAKQSVGSNFGLLMDNPQEYMRQINESARDVNRQDSLAVQGKRAMLSGMQPTPEQAAAMEAMRQRAENLAMGFVGNIKQTGLTPQEIANITAQKNAVEMIGLPPNNTAMDRAKAMGFDTDIFHASSKTPAKSIYENGVYLGTIEPELRTLDKVIPNKGGGEGGAFFATNATDIAKTYAIPSKERAGATYPLKVRSADFMQSGFNKPMPEGSISQWMKEVTSFNRGLDKTKNRYFNEKIKESKNIGKGGVVFKNVEDAAFDIGSVPMSDIYAITNAPVRSKFAAFDPARINETDLLAAGVPFGLLANTNIDIKPTNKKKKDVK